MYKTCHCYCECQDWTLLHVTPSSAVFRLDNLKVKSPDNSRVTRAQFHAFGWDKLKLDQLKIVLEVVDHASLPVLQPRISISGCSCACGSYQDFLDRGFLLTRKLLNQGFLLVKLKSSRRKFYGRHYGLVDRYGISVSHL